MAAAVSLTVLLISSCVTWTFAKAYLRWTVPAVRGGGASLSWLRLHKARRDAKEDSGIDAVLAPVVLNTQQDTNLKNDQFSDVLTASYRYAEAQHPQALLKRTWNSSWESPEPHWGSHGSQTSSEARQLPELGPARDSGSTGFHCCSCRRWASTPRWAEWKTVSVSVFNCSDIISFLFVEQVRIHLICEHSTFFWRSPLFHFLPQPEFGV